MESTDRLEEIQRAIDRAARYLPVQGPIDVFVAQNILQGFEEEPFEQAVVHAARMYGTEPYLPESRYREELARGRIGADDLDAVLAADLGDRAAEPLAGGRVSLGTLLRGLLEHPVRQEDDVAVRWTLSESAAIDSEAQRDLWLACMEMAGLARPVRGMARPPVRLRDLVAAVDPAVDADALVHPVLIRLCAAYLDQGVA
ncbi:MAG: putative inorganic carbon transporter subunit DabA, partial [Planctomycetia bacterium]